MDLIRCLQHAVVECVSSSWSIICLAHGRSDFDSLVESFKNG